MDAVDFLKKFQKMCKSHEGPCHGDYGICPLREKTGCDIRRGIDIPEEEFVNIVEIWPHKMTNAMKFKEVFGIDLDIPPDMLLLNDRQVLAYHGINIADWLKRPYEEPTQHNNE